MNKLIRVGDLPAESHSHKEKENREDNEEPAIKRALIEGHSSRIEHQERQDKAGGVQVLVRDAPDRLHTGMNNGNADIHFGVTERS